jgi:DNA topoisomerase-2
MRMIDNEEIEEGGIPAKEYDYLLTMPLWNLSEERVEELQRLLKEKRKEYDTLFAMPIFAIWEKDLDKFLVALQEQEDKEEKDRRMVAQSNHQGGGGKKKTGGQKKIMPKDNKKKPTSPAPQKKKAETNGFLKPKPKALPQKDTDDMQMSFMDRL